MEIRFFELVSCTGGTTTYTGEDFIISAIQFDSRKDMKNAAFIAFETEKDDGHNYVPVAAGKGAVALIVCKEIAATIPVIKVVDTRTAYQEIARFVRAKYNIPMIAITGSNGKTTVKDMLTAILSTKYKVLSTEKNNNNELGVPMTLLSLNESHEAAVLELGMNHKGEIHTLSGIVRPDIAIITKIGTAHIGNLGGTREDIFRAKMEIVDGLQENGQLILCSNDDMLCTVAGGTYYVVYCGSAGDQRDVISADGISQFWNESGYGISFTVHYQDKQFDCTLPILGKHNVQNALLAMTAALSLGIEPGQSIEALRSYARSSMRLETSNIRGVKIIKDYYNASAESMKAALDTLGELGIEGSRVAILGEMLELGDAGVALHREIAEYTKGRADEVFYLGSHGEEFLEIRPDAQCFTSKSDLNEALSSAILNHQIEFGDIVLIKGSKGMKMWEHYEFLYRLLERGSIVAAQTRLLIDVDALKHNLSAVKQYVGDKVTVMPIIKADAYGSGADVVANVYRDCEYFGVSDLCEAEELHAIMPNAKCVVLYQPFPSDIDWVIRNDYLIIAVSEMKFVNKLNHAAEQQNKKIVVHMEVDTGMSRLGVLPEGVPEFARQISKCKNLMVQGIFTHYSVADRYEPEHQAYTAEQTRKFAEAIREAEEVLGPIPFKHACASAAIFNPNTILYNMVRPGYMLYGYYPCEEMKDKISLRPSLKYTTQVTQVKEFEAGVSIGYQRAFITKRKSRIAEIPIGYSDGLFHKLSNCGAFVINGQLAPIVGNICMDYTMVDVTDIKPMVWAGDEVAVFDNVNMTIEQIAKLCDTIGYEVITNIKNKADRIENF